MGLKRNIIKALYSEPTRWVNFRFLNRMIAPMGFYHLASLVHTGKIKVNVDGTLTNKALYDPSSNTIIARDHSFGEDQLAEKAILIHEAAHALLDRFFSGHDINGKRSTMRVVDDETIGFLAGAIYAIAANVSGLFARDKPSNEAVKIARPKVKASMKRGWDGCYTIDFSPREVFSLQAAIKAHPFYKAECHLPAQHDG
jgi:hypothetical protein